MSNDVLLVDNMAYFFDTLKREWDLLPNLVQKATRNNPIYITADGDTLKVIPRGDEDRVRGLQFDTLVLQIQNPISVSDLNMYLRRCKYVVGAWEA